MLAMTHEGEANEREMTEEKAAWQYNSNYQSNVVNEMKRENAVAETLCLLLPVSERENGITHSLFLLLTREETEDIFTSAKTAARRSVQRIVRRRASHLPLTPENA